MSLVPPSPHHSRCGPGDLLALVRVWQWEEQVRRHLGDVVYGNALSVAYQPVFRLSPQGPVLDGYEAYARFPAAPRVPTRLWFHVAREEGFGPELDLAAVRRALGAATIHPPLFLAVNSTLPSLPAVVELLSGRPTRHLVEVGHCALAHPGLPEMLAAARGSGVTVAVDDVPLAHVHHLQPELARVRPDLVKVDLLGGLVDEPMARFNLAAAAAWCAGEGIGLMAERVERARDLDVLSELGVEWAQGYGLAPPVPEVAESIQVESIEAESSLD